MATSRFSNLDEEKQQAILRAAAEEFAQKGFEGASINQIIDSAGISKGSMYYYFEDKADLYATTVRESIEQLVEQSGGFDVDALEAETFWEQLLDYSRRSLPQLEKNPVFIQLAQTYFEELDSGEHPDVLEPIEEYSVNWTARFIERGQELGVIREDLPVEYLAGMINAVGQAGDRIALQVMEDKGSEAAKKLVEEEIEMMRRMLVPNFRKEGGE
ncbi:MAG: TetR/AcrR family transcriptional regulator [Myxococcota bacterium]